MGFADASLGVVWPAMREDFGLPVEAIGLPVGIIKAGGMISSLVYGYFGSRLRIGRLMAVNAALAAIAMFGAAASPRWALVVLLTVPFGMCAGAVSSAVNGHTARNYSSRHLIWGNCAWGVGMTCCTLTLTGIMSVSSWRAGYIAVASILAALAALFARSSRLWEAAIPARPARSERLAQSSRRIVFPGAVKFRRVFAANCVFCFAYAGVETAPGLWGTSLFINVMGSSMEAAGFAVSLYWGSLTAGRFLAGAAASRASDARLIRLGVAVTLFGAALLSCTNSEALATAALALMGFGIAPVFPSMIHDIPRRIGDGPSGRLTGAMLGANYLGAAVMPFVIGLAASRASIAIVGPAMLILLLIIAAAHEASASNALYKRARIR
jgi:fucose permease